MPSLVIWDARTGSIVACMRKAIGNAPAPTIRNVFPHRPDLWEHLRSEWIDEGLTTVHARKVLRIAQGKILPKPSLSLAWLDSGNAGEAVLNVQVTDLLEGEQIADIEAVLDSEGMESVSVLIQPGSQTFEFAVPGTYRLRVVDDRVKPVYPCEVIIAEGA